MLAKENCNASSKLSSLLMLYLLYLLYTHKKLTCHAGQPRHPRLCVYKLKTGLQPPAVKMEVAIVSTQLPPPFVWFGEGG